MKSDFKLRVVRKLVRRLRQIDRQLGAVLEDILDMEEGWQDESRTYLESERQLDTRFDCCTVLG